MRQLRELLELLLNLVFAAARNAFLLQGLAVGAAGGTLLAVAPADMPDWLAHGLRSALLLSGLFFAAGVALVLASRWRPRVDERASDGGEAWLLGLALSLLVLPAYAALAAAELVPLWREIGARLESVGFWDAFARGGAGSGPVMLPILLALLVPALVSAAAGACLTLPLGLLPSLVTRSRRLPALLAMSAVMTSACVATGWIAASALAHLAGAAAEAMLRSGDAETERLAGELLHVIGTLGDVATALVPAALGLAGAALLLRPGGAPARLFAAPPCPVPVAPSAVAEPPAVAPARTEPPRVTAPLRYSAPSAPRAPSASLVRRGLVGLGAAMILFGAADATRTRARFVSADPSPRARLDAAPSAVRIRLAAALDPASSLLLTRIASSPGEVAVPIEVAVRLAPDDATGRTLEAQAAPLARGLYHVQWSALPAGGGVPRHGTYEFGVGVDVPPDSHGSTYSLVERDAGSRGRRHAWLGGVLLLVLGLVLPRLTAGGGRTVLSPLARSGPRRPAASRQ